LSTKEPEKIEEIEEEPGRTITQVTINSANIIDNADGQLFPSLYAQIQSTTGLDVVQLGALTGVRSLLQAVSTPLWGWWSDRHSRKRVLAFGCFFWAIFTILTAFSMQYIDMLIYRAITGIGLAVIIPTTQSLIADYFPPAKRGTAFGWLGLTGVIGVVFGTIFATALVTDTAFILGMDSWRFVLVVWGVISITIGFIVLIFSKDPIRGKMEPELAKTITAEKAERYKVKLRDYTKILKNKTFLIIVLQGTMGSIPWNGILFMIIWFEYIGFDPLTAGLIFSLIAVAAAVGNLFGGWLGDKAAKWRPRSGRIIIAQISVFAGIPLTLVIFYLIPMVPGSMLLYIIFGAITGLLISWTGPGTNNPIFSEIFEPEIRSSVYSVDRVFEGAVAALGTLIVGAVAVIFGYITPPLGTPISALPDPWRIANMVALAQAMFWVALIPWILCLIFYTFVYKTYPKDVERIHKVLQERRKEMETMT
jgi:MFS family permease